MGLAQDVREDINGNQYVNLQDGIGTAIQSTSASGLNGLAVYVTNPMSVSIGVADKTTYTYGTSSFEPVGGVFQDTSPTLTAGQSGAFRLTANRAVHTNLRTAAGVELGDSNADGLFVKPGDGTNTQAYSATSEAFTQLRQGGNVANVNASNQLQTADANSALINAKLSPATATLTQIAVALTTGVALASNAARKGALFVNDGLAIVKLAFAATATSTAYTIKLQANSTYEMTDSRVYTGVISFIGSLATGNLVITELT